jgi:hypothetical protein
VTGCAFVNTNRRSPDNNLIEAIEIRGEDTTARIQITDSVDPSIRFPAKQCIKAVEDEGSPFGLFLGKASVMYAKQRSQELYRDAVTWEDISNVVDYPEVPEEIFKT